MSDYIDRQAALNAINIEREYMTRRQEWGAEHILTHYGYRIIADIPSADVEPVVRCKDCHFFEQDHWETVNGVPLIVAHNICTRWGRGCQTAEDGFCFMAILSQGARMDGDANAE